MAKKLQGVKLSEGCHPSYEDGVCVMEAVSYITDQEITDAPPCVSETIIDIAVHLNDTASDKERQRLIRLVPKMIGTAPTIKDAYDGLKRNRNDSTYLELEERRQEFLESKKGKGVYEAKSFRARYEAFERLLDIA